MKSEEISKKIDELKEQLQSLENELYAELIDELKSFDKINGHTFEFEIIPSMRRFYCLSDPPFLSRYKVLPDQQYELADMATLVKSFIGPVIAFETLDDMEAFLIKHNIKLDNCLEFIAYNQLYKYVDGVNE